MDTEQELDASTSIDTPVDVPNKATGVSWWDSVRDSPAFWPGVALALGLALLFWSFFAKLPQLWMGDDGYYSHGFLVPLITGFVVYRWWPKLKTIPAKASWLALIPLAATLYVARAATVNVIDTASSITFVFALLFSIAFIAGWRWMFALTLPTMYLLFALPIWTMAITVYTNPLQILSTKVAYQMLNFTGFHPLKDGNVIYLTGFTLDVGVPCSGLKLVLALGAFTAFFMFIGNLRWWGNVIMAALVLPLALFINGLRIMLIGVVGVNYGPDAGHSFHDYSGYITLVVCFFILFKIARWLGWKD